MKNKRRVSSVRAFNEYVNELISEYQTTGEVNYVVLALKHCCIKLPRNRFFLMHLHEITRCLNTEETEQIWNHIRDPRHTEAPIFSNVQGESESSASPSIECSCDSSSETAEDNDNININRLTNWFSKTKDKIKQLFVRNKVDGYYMQQATTPDGDDVFVWRNNKRIDYVLRMRNNEVVEYGVLEEKDDDLKNLKFDRLLDGRQSFRVAFALKTLLAEAERKNAIYAAKQNAIAEILLINDGKW